MANVILTASAGIAVKQTAGDAGQKYFATVFIFDFIQAAFSTAITQRFPFIDRHLGKRFFLPKFCAKAAVLTPIPLGHFVASISRAKMQSASICWINASKPSNDSSGRKNSTNPMDRLVP